MNCTGLLSIPCSSTCSPAVASLYMLLPLNILSLSSYSSLRSQLKHHFLSEVFPDSLSPCPPLSQNSIPFLLWWCGYVSNVCVAPLYLKLCCHHQPGSQCECSGKLLNALAVLVITFFHSSYCKGRVGPPAILGKSSSWALPTCRMESPSPLTFSGHPAMLDHVILVTELSSLCAKLYIISISSPHHP